MASLPDEIWTEILDYLEPVDIISCQATCKTLCRLARADPLWKFKCFEKAPSAAAINPDRPDALAALAGALGGLSISGSPPPSNSLQDRHPRPSKRARRVAEWDNSGPQEQVIWYSEYIARHAPLSTIWYDDQNAQSQEIRGAALYEQSQKVVGCLEDGSIAVWDVRERAEGARRFCKLDQSEPNVLFEQNSSTAQSSSSKGSALAYTDATDCVNVDTARQKTYVAVGHVLNEVDLGTLQVVSQASYAWPITALSQQGHFDLPMSVGTSWSLHLYDPRIPFRDRSRSPEDLLRSVPGQPEESIAFLPNFAKGQTRPILSANPLPTGPSPSVQQMMGFPVSHAHPPRGRAELSDFAQIEPGPLSILHYKQDDILVAGRFPSILSYDRRFFPRLQHVMHSGARLSCLTTIPYPPKAARSHQIAEATLVACGEYGGRGSLELYQLPHERAQRTRSVEDFGLERTSPELGAADREHALLSASSSEEYPFSYKNRNSASSAKLLSVATQGTRIVFSDAEGGIKWIERDGSGLARRWNINAWQYNEHGGSPSGEYVARRIIPMTSTDSEHTARGDNDLFIWTGEKIGIVTTKPQFEAHDELVKAFEDKADLNDKDQQQQAEEYSKTMRRALERQADERRWMSQFRLKRGLF